MKRSKAICFEMIAIFCVIVLFGGCVQVKPWQKGNFTKAHMRFEPDPLDAQFRQHVFESKEAASGGYGIGSVGCGCK